MKLEERMLLVAVLIIDGDSDGDDDDEGYVLTSTIMPYPFLDVVPI